MDEIGAGGGGGGSTTLAGLNDVALSSVADGDVLIYDSSLNKWKNGSSSGSGHTYSTTEKNVGIWVDGNTLYEKTYVFTIANLNDGLVDSSVIRGNFYLDIANVSSIWIDYGASFLKNTYSGLNPKSLSLNYAAGGSNYTRTNIQQSAVNSGLPFIYFENTWAASVFYDARSYLTWYITVKYTKTS